MIPSMRKWYNENFTEKKYRKHIADIENIHPGSLDFRIAETPIFIDNAFKEKMLSACEHIINVITQFNFKHITLHAIPTSIKVPNENDHSHFIALDFGICQNEKGELEPQLVEMQGFPTLFCYEMYDTESTRENFQIPENFDSFLNGFDREKYISLLKDIIVANEKTENTILLEIFPHKQKTRIDFYATQNLLGIPIVCLTELVKEGKKLYYMKDGKKIPVHRIYNRIIFDDLDHQSPEIREKGKILFEEMDVQWVPHPNWFYRISKYTLPYIQHPYVPKTQFLSDLKSIPQDLENYVLKPLFSFAGQGVVIDVKKEDIDNVKDPHNWILQKKVKYADIIQTPDIPAKAEIRIFYFWKDGESRPVATHNLARLSKGKMVGVRYNADKAWVGSSIAFFEK
ncbi:MAG: hypothetical protein JSS67_01270 [Bacteroidetes bacterium]|nr:hypothetical protein [Bacteroidota bacterium]